jgi:hypothetical protein
LLEHIDHLRTVLQRLRAHGVKLKAKKCNLFQREVCYLGRIVSEKGYRIDPKNVSALKSLKETPPKSIGEVRKLLGLLGYYRRYVPDFSRLEKLLFDLLKDTGKANCVRSSKPRRMRPVTNLLELLLTSYTMISFFDLGFRHVFTTIRAVNLRTICLNI